MALGGSATGRLSTGRLFSHQTELQLHTCVHWTLLQRNLSEKICPRGGLELGVGTHFSKHVNWLERWGTKYAHPEMSVENIC